MVRKCEKCNTVTPGTLEYCPYCLAKKRWDPEKYIKKNFTPRLQDDLRTDFGITVKPVDLIQARKRGGGLYLFGKTGSGKTLYAAHIMLQSIREWVIKHSGPRSVKLITVTSLLDEIKASFENPTEIDPIKFYSEIDLLILDDIGSEKITDWTIDRLYQIINNRYEYLRPTVYTSNLPIDDLAGMLGDRIPSRIQAQCDFVQMKDINYRE